MKLFRALLAIAAGLMALSAIPSRAESYEPSGTYMFAVKDSCELFLDIYEPVEGSVTAIDGQVKPTIIFAFGGGFMSGERTANWKWYKRLNEAGYKVVTFDYRLGLKGYKGAGMKPKFIKALKKAIDMAVEDLFSATVFIIENGEELGIDPASLVISGSSAGAITSLQAEWEICNGTALASVLPEGFNYAGVMSFSGAIFSTKGSIKYTKMEPCPTLMCHGTTDKIVPFEKLQFLNLCFAGSNAIAKVLAKEGYNYNYYRYTNHAHEIAGNMEYDLPHEYEFLENNVMKGEKKIVDIEIDDPEIAVPDWAKSRDFKNLYD